MRRVVPVVAALAALAAACGDTLAPDAVAGRWVLREVGGAPLPVTVLVANGETTRVVADTFRFGADRRGTHVGVQEITRAGAPAPVTRRWESVVWFEIRGDRVEVNTMCPPDANCAPPPHLVGRIEGGRLMLASPNGGGRALVYAAVGGG